MRVLAGGGPILTATISGAGICWRVRGRVVCVWLGCGRGCLVADVLVLAAVWGGVFAACLAVIALVGWVAYLVVLGLAEGLLGVFGWWYGRVEDDR